MHSGVVALVGPPNAGKTTLYNWLTGSRYRSVNYPGSTVEYFEGLSLDKYGPVVKVLDTPGIRSINPHSPEEKVTIDAIKDQGLVGKVDILVVPVDATQMSRHLLLVKQLQDAGFSIIVALTMLDLLKERHLTVNSVKLSEKLQIPVVEIDGRLGGGVGELFKKAQELICSEILKERPVSLRPWSDERIKETYRELDHLVNEVMESPDAHKIHRADPMTLKVDRWLMHPIFGLLLFFLVMTGLFTAIFSLAEPFMDLLDGLFSTCAERVEALAPGSLWADFAANGLITGIGSVAVFIPQIMILFFGISLLEDTGYLARAATLVDRPLSFLGLNGRSFVPLLSGYACAIPAMMAARTISNFRERLITIFIIPLMSCSARLPVYALLLAFLLPKDQPWKGGLALSGLYFTSLIIGALAAAILSRIWKAKDPSWFMMELPTYRRPSLRTAIKTTFDRTHSYVRRAGGMILFISLTLWALTTFPSYKETDEGTRLEKSYAAHIGHVLDPVMAPMGGDWRVGVGLLSAFAAREVFVSSLALIFHISDESEEGIQTSMLSAMGRAKMSSGEVLFTPSSVIGLLVFFIIALQCLPTVAMSIGESGLKWFGLGQLVVFNVVAYALAVGLVQGLRFLGLS